MGDLIDKLKALQGNKTQEEFAAELGITQPTLSRILGRQKGIGQDTARKIVRQYPDLARDVMRYFLSDDMPTDHSIYLRTA